MRHARRALILVLAAAASSGGCAATRGEPPNDSPGIGTVTVPENAPGSAAAPTEPGARPDPAPAGIGTTPEEIATPGGAPAAPAARPPDPIDRLGPLVWGVAGLRGFAFGERTAPNGVDYKALFALELNFNLWLWRARGVYAFNDSSFWGQRAAPGITNPSQGPFDFSKRELDESIGVAWNYYGRLEARAFAYSFNNLNRGFSAASPTGFKDGAGVENRWYVGGSYPDLGRSGFDVARATFVGAGYYPSKEMVDMDGNGFKPGPFARAYLTLDLCGPRYYLYADTQVLGQRNLRPKTVSVDAGLALRPFPNVAYLEFRLGSADQYDAQLREWAFTAYGAVRFIY